MGAPGGLGGSSILAMASRFVGLPALGRVPSPELRSRTDVGEQRLEIKSYDGGVFEEAGYGREKYVICPHSCRTVHRHASREAWPHPGSAQAAAQQRHVNPVFTCKRFRGDTVAPRRGSYLQRLQRAVVSRQPVVGGQ